MVLQVIDIQRVSTDENGIQGDDTSLGGAFSDDGTKIVFASESRNLIESDTNGRRDIFVKDLVTGEVICASVSSAGIQSNNNSDIAVISPDGTKVAFQSGATNLAPGDQTDAIDIFLKDLVTGAVIQVNTDSNGVPASTSFLNGNYAPVFSPDGTKVLFRSGATNLVSGDTNNIDDIFLKDLITGTTTRISTDSNGNQVNGRSEDAHFSPDGTKVIFTSYASNLVPGDTNGVPDVFVKDLVSWSVTRVSTDGSGNQLNAESSEAIFLQNGNIAFKSLSSNAVANDTNGFYDIFVKNIQTGVVTRVSTDALGNQANAPSYDVSFSADGTKAVFLSGATNLVPGDTNGVDDVFLKDLTTGSIIRVNVDLGGIQANNYAFDLGISADGSKIIFSSLATNIVPGDTNAHSDVFIVTIAEPQLLYGTPDGDTLVGGNGTDTIFGEGGEDTLIGNGSSDTIIGGGGNDYIDGGTGNDLLAGGEGNDGIVGGSGDDSIYGEDGNDVLSGGDGVDSISGASGVDYIVGGSSNDVLSGGDDDDSILGEDGNDYLNGGSGNDTLAGGSGQDSLVGDLGDDYLSGGDDNDTMSGGEGADSLSGDSGDDYLTGGSGNDIFSGGGGADHLLGDDGNDYLAGDDDNDVLFGGTGMDVLIGGAGSDFIVGGDDVDTLAGGAGLDVLYGGGGKDWFAFDAATAFSGTDIIGDFSQAEGDVLYLGDLLSAFNPLDDAITDFVRATEESGSTTISVDVNGETGFENIAVLQGVTGVEIQDLFDTGRIQTA